MRARGIYKCQAEKSELADWQTALDIPGAEKEGWKAKVEPDT